MAGRGRADDLAVDQVRSLLRCDLDTGRLFWLERPREMFPTGRHWATWNTRYANAEALSTPDGRGYLYGEIFRRPYRAHRVVWLFHTGQWPLDQVDHINGDKADNRWGNLRAVSNFENSRNKGRNRNNTSGINGVCWHKGNRKWRAYIMVGGRLLNLGYFDSVEAAAACRSAANVEHGFSDRHGDPLAA